jgi:3-hydroxyacyl-[acyl-carrier-protein] dehydratase
MVLEHQEIKQFLRQRFPFLLVDRIVELELDRAVGLKNVTATDVALQGHFPDEPILPGVLLLEAMSQVGGVLLAHDPLLTDKSRGYLAAIDKVKFKKFVVPGDQVVIEATKVAVTATMARVRTVARVAEAEVATGEISYYFAP